MINIIVARTTDGAIGKNGDQLYYISDDLRHFKAHTSGNTVIMGRKTFEALPKGPLPNRLNIVVTRNKNFQESGVVTANSLDEAIALGEGEIFIIGGGQIYRDAIPLADRIYITEIDATRSDADTFFPSLPKERWRLSEEGEWKTDEKSGLRFRFLRYDRKENP